MKKRAWIAVVGVVALLLVAAFAVDLGLGRRHPRAPTVAPALTGTPSSASSRPSEASSPSPSSPSPTPIPADPELAGCLPQPHDIVPVRIIVEGRFDSKVLSVGMEGGAAGAPPKSDRRAVAWYMNGPKPGSARGHVILTAHTWGDGSAPGDELGSPASGFKPGELIRLIDAAGAMVCYRYTQTVKVWVADYKEDSTVFYNPDGPARIAWMVCWDFNGKTREWDSRLVFYAEPVWQK